jgi:predicted DNA-binding protein
MTKKIYARTLAFRTTPLLDDMLRDLSDQTNRHQSDLIRDAVWKYCAFYRDKAHEILKIA